MEKIHKEIHPLYTIYLKQNNQVHREDGPAIEWGDGEKYWYYHGKYIPCKTQQEFEKLIKLQVFW